MLRHGALEDEAIEFSRALTARAGRRGGAGVDSPACAETSERSTTSSRRRREDEVHAAALQYVRKISGFTKPSQANAEAFERAVEEVAEISRRLLGELTTNAPPKDREVEAAKARARAAERYGRAA